MDLAAGFWAENDQWIIAALTLAIAAAVAFAVDRLFQRRAHRLAAAIGRGGLSREADTRLRFVRRLVYVAILLAGGVLALAQFEGAWRIAASVLASGVVLAAIVGFAARQTLANLVAGVILAITQPIRIGDWIAFEDNYGQVDDVRLNYTILRVSPERRVLIPNEKLAGGVVTNETLVRDQVAPEVSVWIPPGADLQRACELLGEESAVAVAEATPWGVRLAVTGEPVPAAAKAEREAALRAHCLARLRAAGLLEGFPPLPRS
jgi:small-conductance mechanosensitive channel